MDIQFEGVAFTVLTGRGSGDASVCACVKLIKKPWKVWDSSVRTKGLSVFITFAEGFTDLIRIR